MEITYIHHSAFLAENADISLLFDYFQGPIPPVNADKPLYVFASHRHRDHFDPIIFTLAQHFKTIRYILSSDIKKSRVPEELRCAVTFLQPGQTDVFLHLQVSALRSTDEGVAFLIQTDDETLYHAGDLNHWYWREESGQWNREMKRAYLLEISKLKGRCIDFAFIPADPRLADAFSLGAAEFAEIVCPRYILPMHFWEDYTVSRRLKEIFAARGLCSEIILVEKEPQHFIF